MNHVHTTLLAAVASLSFATVALATAVDRPLTPEDFVTKPRVEFPPRGSDFPPTLGHWVRIRGFRAPVFILNNFPLPYLPCWEAMRLTEPCIEDEQSAHPPRP